MKSHLTVRFYPGNQSSGHLVFAEYRISYILRAAHVSIHEDNTFNKHFSKNM